MIDEAGISVDVQPRWLINPFLRPLIFGEGSRDAPLWSAGWSQLAPVEVGKRTAVLRTEGTRGCRVGFLFDTGCEKLVEQLTAHQVQVKRVKTTFWWYFR
ncbi:MAG: hypothetical protein M0T77_08840 [Actinomycetota bacterium]|nr:hypothetical protein [Actinomycetota bacterium]